MPTQSVGHSRSVRGVPAGNTEPPSMGGAPCPPRRDPGQRCPCGLTVDNLLAVHGNCGMLVATPCGVVAVIVDPGRKLQVEQRAEGPISSPGVVAPSAAAHCEDA